MKTLPARIVLILLSWFAITPLWAQSLPTGFQTASAIGNRTLPTNVAFAHDGRVFVTEKSGLIWVYRNLLDTNPQVLIDLKTQVHDYWDRGLLGIALDPRFPEAPYLYVQYTYNGGLFPATDPVPWVPRWPGCPANNPMCGVGGGTDTCPNPPGDTTLGGGCVVSGHISRLTVDEAAGTAGNEQVLVEDWYQQYPSHSIGTIQFGPDGYLYAGGGDGANFGGADYGQWGNATWPDQRSPLNPGNPNDPATNQGGALRAQGLEVEAQYTGQVWLNGTIIRIDPATGLGAPGNPLAASGNTDNAKRIVAYGLRNPFRFTMRPGTNGEVWVGNVGYNTWESIEVIPSVAAAGGSATLKNFGWPCFEGRVHTQNYSTSNLPICNTLYSNSNTGGRTPWTPPWYTYNHSHGSSDITGLAFYTGTSYPAQYQNSLFFADNSRGVIFNVPYVDANGDGLPDPPADNTAPSFVGATAVDLAIGPGGDVFFTDITNGKITRLFYCGSATCTNQAPSAAIALDAGSSADGGARTIAFTAANSVDPNTGDTLSYDWDLNGDGQFGDASGVTASHVYNTQGSYRVAVRVTDQAGASDVQSLLVTVTLPPADVGVTLDDGVTLVRRGDVLHYTLVATNHGANAVSGEHVATALSTQLSGIAWTCSAGGGASCAASGSGKVADTVDLPAGASVTYTITATVGAAAEGTITSTATVTAPAGYNDPNPSDNTAADVDTVDDTIFKNGFD